MGGTFGTRVHLPRPPFWKPPFCEAPRLGQKGGHRCKSLGHLQNGKTPEIQKIGEKLAKYRKILCFAYFWSSFFPMICQFFSYFLDFGVFPFCRWPRLLQGHRTNLGVFVPMWPVSSHTNVLTGHIGTNTPKFCTPFDPNQTGLCKFGRGFGAR